MIRNDAEASEVVDLLADFYSAGVQAVNIVAGEQWALATRLINEAADRLHASDVKRKKDKADKSDDSDDDKAKPQDRRAWVTTWNMIHGFYPKSDWMNVSAEVSKALSSAVELIGVDTKELPTRGFFVFEQPDLAFPYYPESMLVIRRIISEQKAITATHRRMLVFVTISPSVPPDLQKYVPTIHLPKPSEKRIEAIVANGVKSCVAGKKPAPTPEVQKNVEHALRGLGDQDTVNLLALAAIRTGGINEATIGQIEELKSAKLGSGGCLEYVPRSRIELLPEVAGYDVLMDWVKLRKVIMDRPNARLDPIKGAMLLGVPGTGKSIAGKLIAKRLGRPFIRFDLSAVYGSLVGESEAKTRDAIATVTAQKGCVLLLDEVDKLLGNAHESKGDSGVTQRILGSILTWMAEKRDETFVLMTANRVEGLPVELTRKGRLDEIFFVDTPKTLQRKEIFEIHLRHRHVDTSVYTKENWKAIVKAAEGYVGAEIESAVGEAVLQAYVKDLESNITRPTVPTVKQLITAITSSPSMLQKSGSEIEKIRKWGKKNARNVCSSADDHEYGEDPSEAAETFRAEMEN